MNRNSKKQMGLGAVISYFMIIANALFGVFVTPFILTHLGISAFGVYKTIGSLSASLLILDLGIGGTLMRYIAKYRANSEYQKVGPFVSMIMCECGILIPIIVGIEIILYSQLDSIYANSFTSEELFLAKQIFIVLSINIILNIIEHFLNGVISGHNDFIFGNGIKLGMLLTRILLILVLLPSTKSAVLLVMINLVLILGAIIIQLVFILKRYHIHISFDRHAWERGIFKESFVYTLLIFLTTITAQVNSNLDNVIVGAYCGTEAVAIYSFGLLIFGMFQQLSTSISGVALPTVSNIIVQEHWEKKVQQFIVRMGRIQFMLLGAATVGFVILGKEFISLWLGKGYGDVYRIVLILIIPSMFELCVNGCLAVLRAKNILGFRTAVLIASTILNLIISIAGIRYIGYYSAALGTAMSFIVGSLIVMNVYYYKKLSFNMVQIYYEILHRTVTCILVAGITTECVHQFINGTWIAFFLNVIFFLIVYVIMLLLWGFTTEERSIVKKATKKIYMMKEVK